MRLILVLAALLLCAGGRRALGQTCGAAATGLAFGTYQPLSGLSASTTATVTVTCNPGAVSLLVSYTVQLGGGSGGSVASRSLASGAARLGYQIYTSALYTQVWGDGTAGSVVVSDSYLLGVVFPIVRTYTAYGIIPANQTSKIGTYSDLITVLITY